MSFEEGKAESLFRENYKDKKCNILEKELFELEEIYNYTTKEIITRYEWSVPPNDIPLSEYKRWYSIYFKMQKRINRNIKGGE